MDFMFAKLLDTRGENDRISYGNSSATCRARTIKIFNELAGQLRENIRAHRGKIKSWFGTKQAALGGLSPREYLRGKDREERTRVGHEALVKHGVLKP